ncbi:glycosyltransferase family 4 protein [Candidatus Falkowbacteria bacterium]|nr:glycosyltransferase family 4 protein [Candidatus Falkowbacteria bacterium]
MKIGIDARCLMNKNYSGVSYYTFNLLKAIFALDKENQYLLFYNSSKKVDLPEFNQPNVKYVGFHWPNKIFNLALNFFNEPKIDKLIGGVDIFFAPNLHFVAWSENCKKVIAVHDLSFLRFPEFFIKKMQLWHKLILWKNILGQADMITADSENTKNDLIELLKIPEGKIKVVYLGVSEEFRVLAKDDIRLENARKKYNLPEKFILYLGTLEPRKNIESIVEAFNLFSPPFQGGVRGGCRSFLKFSANLPPSWAALNAPKVAFSDSRFARSCPSDYRPPPWKGGDEYDLVIAGGVGWKAKNIFKLAKENLKIKFIGYVDDRPALYNLASLFVYPSYYEGFGLPLLEAMACGCPVIAGVNSSQGEVVGEAGLLVDPYNINEIKKAIEMILQNNELRNDFINRGLERAKEFTWQKTAEKVLESFK